MTKDQIITLYSKSMKREDNYISEIKRLRKENQSLREDIKHFESNYKYIKSKYDICKNIILSKDEYISSLQEDLRESLCKVRAYELAGNNNVKVEIYV